MQYKRWRVVAGKSVVNAGVAAMVLFLAGCGPSAPSADDPAAESAPPAPLTIEADRGLTLPAVWSTRALDGPIQDIALAGGPRPLMAVAFEGRGFQLFNLEGERLGEPIGFGVTDLASGQYAEIDGAEVTVFPGIDREGGLKAYVYGDNLQAPVEISLPISPGGEVAGLCAGAHRDGLMRLGYWTEGNDTELAHGSLSVEGGEFAWQPATPIAAISALSACRIDGSSETPLPVYGDQTSAATLERFEGRFAFTLANGGQLLAARPQSGPEPVTLKEGMSVRVPLPAIAMDALGTPQDGGYPYGLVVVAGETAPGVHQAVFVDTTPLVAPDVDGTAPAE